MSQVVLAAFWFWTGACVGSFLNVCIGRWPAEESVIAPPSRCPRCGRPIRWYENIPIVSWLALRTRCAGCGQPISWQYPLVELAVALGWVAAFLAFDLTFSALRVAVLGTVLLGVAITDARHYVIPDGFTVFGLLFAIATSLIGAALGDPGPFAGPWDAVLGACVGAGAIAIVGWLGEVALKREAMGFGDATLMAVAGAAVGPERALLVIFVGAVLATIGFGAVVAPLAAARARRQGTPFEAPLVPFGVFLAPAALVTLLWGEALVVWYLGFITAG